jgi:hypothetical protein
MKHTKNPKEIGINLPTLASKEYLLTKSDDFGWIYDNNFVLAYYIDIRLMFRRMVFTCCLIHKKDNLSLEDEKKFLDELVDYIRANDLCDFVYKPQSNVIFRTYPKGADVVKWGSYIVNLDVTKEELFNSFNQKHRGAIRKAIKENIKVYQTNNLDEVYNLIKDTLVRQHSIHYPTKDYLYKLKENLKDKVRFYVSKKDEKLEGALVLIINEDRALCMYAGSVKKPIRGSINILHYQAMLDMQKLGLKIYDFVGARLDLDKNSKFYGIQRFKKKFTKNMEVGYSFRVIIHPIKFKMFNLLAKVYLKAIGYDYEDPIDNIGKLESA